MSKDGRGQGPSSSGEDLVRGGADAELRLLRQERTAESRLKEAITAMEKDRSRLVKALLRLERTKEGVKVAEMALLAAQERRATGPAVTD